MVLFVGCAISSQRPNMAELRQQVMKTEKTFAKTMVERDHAAFSSFVSDEAVFFSGQNVLRGKERVADWWKRYFEGSSAPFSWEPEQVEVLDSGTLALSSGPVYDPDGKLIATFTSIWRLEEPGVWRIIFDKGNKACD
ncbi:MAG: nuclear transport factor 2 family protein [Candidatus Eiseniibacteriota bacterium]|nr:MAG: nuclear transport factor 2 family protein [Candidatus Eisenbacteria bacterium]